LGEIAGPGGRFAQVGGYSPT